MYIYVCNFHFVNKRECIFVTHDIFAVQMSYGNHRGPYVAPLGYIELIHGKAFEYNDLRLKK